MNLSWEFVQQATAVASYSGTSGATATGFISQQSSARSKQAILESCLAGTVGMMYAAMKYNLCLCVVLRACENLMLGISHEAGARLFLVCRSNCWSLL